MTDSNFSNPKEEQTASGAVGNNKDRCSDAANAPQKSPQTPQSGPVEKEKPAKVRLEEDIAHHRSALYYGPDDPNARFWGILATSHRNRSVNRAELETYLTENEMRKRNTLSNVSSGERLGKASFGADSLHLPEPDIRPTSFRHNSVTIMEV
ncbi:hypothetical protein BPAE_0122g00130 [Botrytis paeoniae]|uniref:Uncharacterized protein n=1 Tax=Botrytis paeoniae TaxID=278948 RepID=A0A4Z1FQ22_9HELO|nr:hypothetical protein BPAE_0122g00130 [Botrytis paeoniae]